MPADVVAKIARDTTAALQTQAFKDRLTTVGATPRGSSPKELDALIRAEYDKWGPIIKSAGIKAE
jgi:tripartite-type tricarboxylate transporter receptor subunit TctC